MFRLNYCKAAVYLTCSGAGVREISSTLRICNYWRADDGWPDHQSHVHRRHEYSLHVPEHQLHVVNPTAGMAVVSSPQVGLGDLI